MKKTLAILLALALLGSLGACVCETTVLKPLEGETPASAAAAPVEEEPVPNADGYRVFVYDTDGNPVEGVMVQFCSEDSCILGKTDAEGAAVFDMPGGETYTVHILKVPQGYEKHGEEYETPDFPSDLSVTINKAA